jgi:hypothetical protein
MTTVESEWGIEQVDVEAYLERVGYLGDRAPGRMRLGATICGLGRIRC